MDCEDVVGGERQWILVDMPVQFRDFFLVLLEISMVGVKRDEAREMWKRRREVERIELVFVRSSFVEWEAGVGRNMNGDAGQARSVGMR